MSRAVLRWLTAPAHIDPGKPWQNGTNESFNGKFRDECLSMEWFRNRIDAKITIEQFRRQYNEIRPHSSLGQLTPVEFKQKSALQFGATHSVAMAAGDVFVIATPGGGGFGAQSANSQSGGESMSPRLPIIDSAMPPSSKAKPTR